MWSDSDGERELTPNEVSPGRNSTASEVVVMDPRVVASAIDSSPTISQLNVSHKSKVHVGPKFVSVTQNVNNAEMVKTRFLGLELISAKNTLRCSIAVFVCWALVVAVGLILYLVRYVLPAAHSRLDLGMEEEWYFRRIDWQATRPIEVEYLKLPLRYVLIGHSVTSCCQEKYSCIRQMMAIQNNHMRRGWDDIGPNFFVSGNGLVFEGRGANVQGAMVRHWNSKSITIMFLGDYTINKTQPMQFQHVAVLLSKLVERGVLVEDYSLLGHCQVSPYIYSPGRNIMYELKYFEPHWVPPKSMAICLSRKVTPDNETTLAPTEMASVNGTTLAPDTEVNLTTNFPFDTAVTSLNVTTNIASETELLVDETKTPATVTKQEKR